MSSSSWEIHTTQGDHAWLWNGVLVTIMKTNGKYAEPCLGWSLETKDGVQSYVRINNRTMEAMGARRCLKSELNLQATVLDTNLPRLYV